MTHSSIVPSNNDTCSAGDPKDFTLGDDVHDASAYLRKFDPYRDERDWVSEDPTIYAKRMQSSLLPHWPTEVLIEWLHRHNRAADRYTFLPFELLRFHKETWSLEAIPNREAFDNPRFCDNFTDICRRARMPGDWLAQHMLRHGTWNTPIILLNNPKGRVTFPNGEPLKSPFHLLEGHRRLSFLNGLRMLGLANPTHEVWIARLLA